MVLYNVCDRPTHKALGMIRFNEALPATHTFLYKWNEPSFLYSPTADHHRTLAGTHSPSRVG